MVAVHKTFMQFPNQALAHRQSLKALQPVLKRPYVIEHLPHVRLRRPGRSLEASPTEPFVVALPLRLHSKVRNHDAIMPTSIANSMLERVPIR